MLRSFVRSGASSMRRAGMNVCAAVASRVSSSYSSGLNTTSVQVQARTISTSSTTASASISTSSSSATAAATATPVRPHTFLNNSVRKFSASASAEEAVFEFKNPFKTYLLEEGPANSGTVTKDELLSYFKTLTKFRRVEIVADTLYKARLIRGFCHLYDGQEAIVAGMEAALGPKDSVITAYRDHCHAMGRGDSAEQVLAELMGKETGSTKGKGGSMHFYNKENNFYGGNGIVGAQVPVGAGVAFAHKYRGDGGACISFFGDGAANQGQIYEAANMAGLWKLPQIFVCENNQYGMGTASTRSAASVEYYKRGHFIPGIWIDGMDVIQVREGLKFALEYVRENGPMFVEMHTYRYHGHSMSDPGISYRSRDEVSAVRSDRDCIDKVKTRLLDQGWATAKELKAMEKEIRKEVDVATEAAKAASAPADAELYNDVYAGDHPPFIRHCEYEESITN
jgi:pyruvate dehydrogenase E1 component subunit alpha